MQEDFIQYIWKMRLFDVQGLHTTAGEPIIILDQGTHNTHAGPDFVNARLRIGETLWAGNVEIHVRSSDWDLHKHQKDNAYKNVILHVVMTDDVPLNHIPTLVLTGRIPQSMQEKYQRMMQTAAWIPCEKHIAQVPPILIKQQITRALAERLAQKALRMEQRLYANGNDWEETLYQMLARGFGMPVNSEPFERTARALPFKIVLKHLQDPFQTEALCMGQAGFLDGSFNELYPHTLQAEYKYLKKKYALESIEPSSWKFLRMRPAHFPTVRMSQFAAMLCANEKLFSRCMQAEKISDIQQLLSVEASGYWREHYHFRNAVHKKSAGIGKQTMHLLVINIFAPFVFLYGSQTGDQRYIDRALHWMEALPAEKNSILDAWAQRGVKAVNAGEGQGLLELKASYCDARRCLIVHVDTRF
ncbi:MAG: DUF2851 family protein [Chitinophagales bacterium]